MVSSHGFALHFHDCSGSHRYGGEDEANSYTLKVSDPGDMASDFTEKGNSNLVIEGDYEDQENNRNDW